jgi:hypothetical protein
MTEPARSTDNPTTGEISAVPVEDMAELRTMPNLSANTYIDGGHVFLKENQSRLLADNPTMARDRAKLIRMEGDYEIQEIPYSRR